MGQEKQQDGLRKKRMLELGMGRAGGYAGFDDEEFEELGGTIEPSREDRGTSSHGKTQDATQGFRIGSQNKEDTTRMDFDKIQHGKSISLVWKGDTISSDYMTIEEEEKNKEKRKNKKKDTKFKKKKKSKKQKNKAPTIPSRSKDDNQQYSEKNDEYDESNLKGMQVRNNLVDLEIGGNTVLTLADATILE